MQFLLIFVYQISAIKAGKMRKFFEKAAAQGRGFKIIAG